jgi:hypothetical protein
MTLLSAILPRWHFREIHKTTIAASAEQVWAAIREVTPREIRLFVLLTGLRSLPARLLGRAPERSGLGNQPLLTTALRSGFLLLAEEPQRELVLGTIGQFWKPLGGKPQVLERPEAFANFTSPGFAKAAMGFHLENPGGSGALRLVTETRIRATSRRALWKFAAYWMLVRPGSALIRRAWLAAIKRRAEAM